MEDLKPTPDMIMLNSLLENDTHKDLWNAEILDPVTLGFIPTIWKPKPQSLMSLRETYFSKKNNVNRRFEHKLWNALRITKTFHNYVPVVGVQWVTKDIIKVYKRSFAYLLNITTIDGGLFHKQGNFTRHGFVELSENEAKALLPESVRADVDFRDVHLLKHKDGFFTDDSTEETINYCKWDNPTGSSRIAVFNVSQASCQDN